MVVLLVFVFLLVLFFAILPNFIPNISKKMVTFVVEGADEENDLRQQLRTLQDEQKTINMTDEFAKYAKLDRKITRLKDELSKQTKSRSEVYLKMKFGANIVYHVVQILTIASVVWTFRREPLLHFPDEWLWPLETIIAFPTGVSGALGITTWLVVSRIAVSKGLQVAGL